MGIQLVDSSGFDSFTASGPEQTNTGSAFEVSFNTFTYNVDLTAGEEVTLTGDFDYVSTSNNAFAISITSPSFGTFTSDSTLGTFSYTISRDVLDANGGNQTVSILATGLSGAFGSPDIDTVNFTFTCFAEGTRIATPTGETAVELLSPGDMIRTADGRDVPVRWVGYQDVSTLFMDTDRLRLVRIAPHALGPDMPTQELRVTADHAILLDGCLITAGVLVNGSTIDFVPLQELGTGYRIYHVELETHDVLLAEGAPTESFVDTLPRSTFGNYDDYLATYGCDQPITRMSLPRISAARMVPPAIRARLLAKEVA